MSGERQYSPDFKIKVMLEIVKREKTVAEASREYGIAESLLRQWQSEFWRRLPELFGAPKSGAAREREKKIAKLERQAKQLEMDNEILRAAARYFKVDESEG